MIKAITKAEAVDVYREIIKEERDYMALNTFDVIKDVHRRKILAMEWALRLAGADDEAE